MGTSQQISRDGFIAWMAAAHLGYLPESLFQTLSNFWFGLALTLIGIGIAIGPKLKEKSP